MIMDIEACTEDELRSQIEYLANTPVWGIAELLTQGRCELKRGVIRSLNYLGSLKTEFGDIGELKPSSTEGENKFLVNEIVEVLRKNPEVDDGGLLAGIENFIEVLNKKEEIEFNVTLFKYDDEFIIKDGDKRTIAFYENSKEEMDDIIEYDVYVVFPIQ